MSFPGAKLSPRQRIALIRSGDDVRAVGGTLTAAGFIPHLSFRGLKCPVMLEVVKPFGNPELYKNARGVPYPMRTRGGYRFALPGGYFVEGPRSGGR